MKWIGPNASDHYQSANSPNFITSQHHSLGKLRGKEGRVPHTKLIEIIAPNIATYFPLHVRIMT